MEDRKRRKLFSNLWQARGSYGKRLLVLAAVSMMALCAWGGMEWNGRLAEEGFKGRLAA